MYTHSNGVAIILHVPFVIYGFLQEHRPDENDNQLKAANVLKDLHDFGASYPSTLNMCRADGIAASVDISSLDKRTQQLLKFVFLFGILTFQGVQNASATSSFMDNLQSDNFFGDLSDISTGFTSVRKISLQLLQFAFMLCLSEPDA